MAIFKHVADKVQSRHFGIVQLPADEAEYRKRREYLLSRNIRPIWYPEGKHQNIEILLRYLVDQLPAHLRITLKPAEERDTIPTPLTSFIGRETERKEVIDLVAKSRLLTLVGAPGSGKTRLAIEVARSVRSDFDHVWFIELSQLAARETRLVAQRVASVLRIYKPGTQSPTEQLAAHLRTGKHLIVIDNCERHVKACATLADTLLRQCPGLKITCTSRRTLDAAGEQLYSVPPLQLPDPEHIPSLKELEELDSVELLVERIRERSYFRLTEENAKAVATLCRGLEGVPLAIELAAAQLQTLSIEEVIARLHQQLKLLTGGTGGEESRQWATLAKAVKLSHELLDSEQALLFRRLSIFHRGWTLEAAASVCSEPHQDEFDILRLLNQLHSMSLMTVEERNGRKRFRLLDFVREYAIERLRDVREDLSHGHKTCALVCGPGREGGTGAPEEGSGAMAGDVGIGRGQFARLNSSLRGKQGRGDSSASHRLVVANDGDSWLLYGRNRPVEGGPRDARGRRLSQAPGEGCQRTRDACLSSRRDGRSKEMLRGMSCSRKTTEQSRRNRKRAERPGQCGAGDGGLRGSAWLLRGLSCDGAEGG